VNRLGTYLLGWGKRRLIYVSYLDPNSGLRMIVLGNAYSEYREW